MARRRRHQESRGELFPFVSKRLPHLPTSTVAEVVSVVPDAKQERAKRPWRYYGGQATAKAWTAQQRLGPVCILDAMNHLHQIYRAGKDLNAPEQIQRLLAALGPMGRGFQWVDPPFNFSFVLVHTLRMLMTLIGPSGLRAGGNDTVQRKLTEGKEHARRCCEVVYRKSPLSRIKPEAGDAEPAWELFDWFGIFGATLTAGETLALQLVNAPPKWRAHLFRCHSYPECDTAYGLDKSHRTDRSARRCKDCRSRLRRGHRKAPRNR